MRGTPCAVATDPDRHSFTQRQVPSVTADQSMPPATVIRSSESLLRQVWAARPFDWQSGDPALADALRGVRTFLIRNGDLR